MIPTSPLTNALFCRSAAAGPHDKLYTYASRIAYATHQRIVRHHLGSNKHLGLGGSYSPPNKYPPPSKQTWNTFRKRLVCVQVGWLVKNENFLLLFGCTPYCTKKSPVVSPNKIHPKKANPHNGIG